MNWIVSAQTTLVVLLKVCVESPAKAPQSLYWTSVLLPQGVQPHHQAIVTLVAQLPASSVTVTQAHTKFSLASCGSDTHSSWIVCPHHDHVPIGEPSGLSATIPYTVGSAVDWTTESSLFSQSQSITAIRFVSLVILSLIIDKP